MIDIPGTFSSEEILQSTFAHAKLLLRSITKPQEFDSLFPTTNGPGAQHVSRHSILDLQQCLQEAQNSYEGRVQITTNILQTVAPTTVASTPREPTTGFKKFNAKTRLWLTILSEKITHYGNIFDVMAQHHSEYVSLAWGTFKLLFIAITNHAETASKIGTSISQIADLLPQHSLHLILYPSPQMQISVARLYAHILKFFVSSLKWYKDNRAVHALKSILQPWDLKFRQEYEAITLEAQHIKRLADAGMQAELRDTRLEVEQGTRHWELVRQEVKELKVENQRLASLFQSKFGALEDSMLSMCTEIRVDYAAHRATLNRLHLNQMLSLPLWNLLPTSGDSLQFCRSMRNRRRERTRLPLPDIKKLEAWSSQRKHAVLIIDTYMPIVANSFMVDMIDLILDNGMPIVWALRYTDYWDQEPSITNIIRTLVVQAMQLGASHLLEGPFPVTVEQLREAAGLGDWVAILKQLLSSISHAFIALDADLLSHAAAHERSMALEMIDNLRLELSSNVKIVIAMSSVSRAYADELERSNACVKIQTGSAGDWRKLGRPGPHKTRFRWR
ncbi:Nn.00g101100.m01.CDS01 [Neocucurbitaria sp. VM-36]